MQKMMIIVTAKQDAWIRSEARRLGTSMNEFIRRIFDARTPHPDTAERTDVQLVGHVFSTQLRAKGIYDGCASITDMIARLDTTRDALRALMVDGVAVHGVCEDDRMLVLTDDAAVARKYGMTVVEETAEA